jgi:hypothetical protein
VWFLPDSKAFQEIDDPQIQESGAAELNMIKDDAVKHANERLLDIMRYKGCGIRSFTRMQLGFK